LAVLKDNRGVDMVVADINMPRMDGLTLVQRLQENEERLSTIIVSAYGDMTNIRAAMNRGAFDFLTKPIDLLDLEATNAKTIRHIGVLREAHRRQGEAKRVSRQANLTPRSIGRNVRGLSAPEQMRGT
jgi:adenylate cyclase